jgi:hypothetical protein
VEPTYAASCALAGGCGLQLFDVVGDSHSQFGDGLFEVVVGNNLRYPIGRSLNMRNAIHPKRASATAEAATPTSAMTGFPRIAPIPVIIPTIARTGVMTTGNRTSTPRPTNTSLQKRRSKASAAMANDTEIKARFKLDAARVEE